MKLLFNQNISYRIVKKLEAQFPNCHHISNCKLYGAKDLEIWSFAKENQYIIVTFDADYYEISLAKGIPPKIIWLRFGNLPTIEIANKLKLHKQKIIDFVDSPEFKEISCFEIE